MKKAVFAVCLLCTVASPAALRPTPEYLKRAVIYQIVLRNFTRGGDFKAATEMLPHVRSTGADVVYLIPFVEMDRDMDQRGWSPRQVKSGYLCPKNPYRVSNYDKIDPEYGSEEDFRAFTRRAHELGLKVFMDVVYLHCGPNNVIKDLFPDAFVRKEDGSVKMTQWGFPYVNLESREIRKYLIDSMVRWVRAGCDGFRCDVGDQVPIDFWVEAASACQAIKPDLVMINEGTKTEWLKKAFDACYAWPWSFGMREMLLAGLVAPKNGAKPRTIPERMDRVRKYEVKVPDGALMFCFVDNHDTATGDDEPRFDRVRPVEAGNAAFVLSFLRRGVPLVFNGNEIADNALNTFYAPVDNVARAYRCVDWGRALQPDGQKRLALIRELSRLRREKDVFADGTQEWIADGETRGAIAFVRRTAKRAVFVAANMTEKEMSFAPSAVKLTGNETVLLADGGTLGSDGICRLKAWGYVVCDVAP